MSILSHNMMPMIKDPDYQKCGEIMVAPKRNIYAMSCHYCENLFTRLPAFVRHLHQSHMNELQFEAKDAQVEVYAVEELVNRTLCADGGVEGDSEESGVADEDFNMSGNEDYNIQEECNKIRNLNKKKGMPKVDGNEGSKARNVVKEATLGNMSIVNALEDCDISLNFVENLDNTMVADKVEGEIETKTAGEENKGFDNDVETDEGMATDDDDDEDLDMESTIVKRIRMDLDMDMEEEVIQFEKKTKEYITLNKDLMEEANKVTADVLVDSDEDEDQNVTLTESNLSKSLNKFSNTRSSGLKKLLSGLDDLDDFDDLLHNIEDDSVASIHQKESKEKLEDKKSREVVSKLEVDEEELLNEFNLNASILKQCLLDDDDDDDDDDDEVGETEKEKKSLEMSKTDEAEDSDISHMSALHLEDTSDFDLDDSDLEDCINNGGFLSRSSLKFNNNVIKDITGQKASKWPKKCNEVIEKSKTPETNVKQSMCMEKPRAEALNTSCFTKSVGTTAKSQRCEEMQKESQFNVTSETLNGSELSVAPVEKSNVNENVVEVFNSLNSVQKTPESTRRICIQITPKTRKLVSSEKSCKENEILAETNKKLVENNKKDVSTNAPKQANFCSNDKTITPTKEFSQANFCRNMDNTITPTNLCKNNLTITPIAKTCEILMKTDTPNAEENGKEESTKKFEEGLSIDKSSTLINEENRDSLETSKKYNTLHSLLTKDLDDEFDLDTLINQIEKNEVENSNEITMKSKVQEQDATKDLEEDAIEEEMAIFRKFIGLECIETNAKGGDQDVDDFENLLNEDLTKALEQALEENTKDSLKLNEDNDYSELKAVEEYKKTTQIPLEMKVSECQKNSFEQSTTKAFQSKYSKTNQRARNVLGKPKYVLDKVKPKLNQITSKSQQDKLQQQKLVDETIKDIAPLIEQENFDETIKKTVKTLKDFKENQEKPMVKHNLRKSPITNLVARQQNSKHHPEQIKIIKKENATPSRCFINTQRGERTPMKLDDLFLKQSPKSREKTGEKLYEVFTQKSPYSKIYKTSPSQCKKNLSQMPSPNTRRTPLTTIKTSPPNIFASKQTPKSSPQPLNAKSPGKLRTNINTPQTIRGLSIKLQRLDANKKTHLISPTECSTSTPSKQQQNTALSPLERENFSSIFKLPNGITISKVNSNAASPPSIDMTPSRSNYCKQNFTEQQVVVGFQESSTTHMTETLINKLPNSIVVTKANVSITSRLRARQASIDNVPCTGRTPKKSAGLDYKSYAVNRSARKKEVLQRMRTIKKRIFKSIASDSMIQNRQLDNKKLPKLPICKETKKPSKINIENVQILPNIENEVMTPLLETQKLSSPHLLASQDDVLEEKAIMSKKDNNNLNTSLESCLEPIKESTSETTPKQSHSKVGKSPETTPNYMYSKVEKSPETTPKQSHSKAGKSPVTTPKQSHSKEDKSPVTTPKQSHSKEDESLDSIQTEEKESKSTELTAKSLQTVKTPKSSPPGQSVKENASPKTPPKTYMSTAKTPTTTGRRGRPAKRQAQSPLDAEECPPKRVNKSPNAQDVKAKHIQVESIANEPMPQDDSTPEKTPEKEPEKNSCLQQIKDNKPNINKPNGEESRASKTEQQTNNKQEPPSDEMHKAAADTSILDDLLEQVASEESPVGHKNTKTVEAVSYLESSTIQDYDDAKDLKLLEIVGLTIINIKDIEDFHTIEEVEEMHVKAQHFADICKQFPRIFFCSKIAEPATLIKDLHVKFNQSFKQNLSISDIKRLINLLIIWYSNCYSQKLIEKKPVFESNNYYLQTFNFIPKTSKRTLCCEFCDDNLNSEHKYYTHRIKHTDAKYPYICKKCKAGFLRAIYLKSHSMVCDRTSLENVGIAVLTQKNQQKSTRNAQENGAKNTIINMEAKKVIKTADNNVGGAKNTIINMEAKKVIKRADNNVSDNAVNRRLHTVYKCAKCEMSFNTESVVKLHITSCNRNQRRQPKINTPRPTKH